MTASLEHAESLLELVDLSASYTGEVDVLQGLSLHVHEGELVSVVGPNGAGKSTVLKAIVGGVRIPRGRILFRGENVVGLPSYQVVRRGVAYVPQRDNVFPRLTVQDNLELGARRRLSGDDRRTALDHVFALFPRLEARRRRRAGSLSGGERQMLAIARALMGAPRLLLLDEPSAGLAPGMVDALFEHIRDIQRGGITILLVEQNARRALSMSDRGYVLDLGQTRFEGPGPELLEDQRVVELYLGGVADAAATSGWEPTSPR